MSGCNMAIDANLPAHNPDSYRVQTSANSNRNIYPSLSSVTTVDHSAIKGFDIEGAMAEALIPQDPNARPKYFRNTIEECIFVFTVLMASSSTTFLQGVILINTATIGKDLHMTAAQITWISAAIGLSSGSFMLFFGKTADLFGRKIQLLAGMTSLSFFSLITAFAPNAIAMNVLCGFLGLGTAAISPPAIGTLFAIYQPGKRRNKATGALGAGNPVGFMLGSISSGIATKLFNWRASFIVIAMFFFVMIVLAFWTMPSIPRSGNVREVVKQFDYLGTVLTVIGFALVAPALTEGPQEGWKSPKVITMLALGILSLFGFGIWENIYTHPLLDPSIWRNCNFTLCILCVLFGYMSFITNQFWISLYMQDVQKLSPLNIAARLLPQTFTGLLWSYCGQSLVSRVSGTIIMGVGALAYLTGAILLIFIRQTTSYWILLFPALCITVIGADFQFIVANLYVNTQMPAQSSLGAGVLQTAMRLSLSLGLATTAAAYGSASQTPRGIKDINFPYERAYLCSIFFALAGLLFVPFLRIGKQGRKPDQNDTGAMAEERPRPGGEYSGMISAEGGIHPQVEHEIRPGSENSTVSLATCATKGSEDWYLPRWSWEGEKGWKGNRCRDGKVTYEVCIKCLEERQVVLGASATSSWREVG